jgi:putative NADPH-quinone reductase
MFLHLFKVGLLLLEIQRLAKHTTTSDSKREIAKKRDLKEKRERMVLVHPNWWISGRG